MANFIKWWERFRDFSIAQLHWLLGAAAAAIWAATLESAASWLSAGWVVEVVSLLTVLATPIVAPLFLVLVTAAASVAERTAAATSSVVVFKVAVVAVALAAFLLVSVVEFLPLSGTSLSGSVSGSGNEIDSGSGSGSPLVVFGVCAQSLAARGAGSLQAALDHLNRVACQFVVCVEIGVYRVLGPAALHHLLLGLHALVALSN
jgi:hypothetical protein